MGSSNYGNELSFFQKHRKLLEYLSKSKYLTRYLAPWS